MGAYGNYLESEVMNAGPAGLVRLLFRGAMDAVGAARRHLKAGDIRERSTQITKALMIVHELVNSLDCVQGGELAERLRNLYAYITKRLIEANAEQADGPLEEVEKLLATLMEAWV